MWSLTKEIRLNGFSSLGTEISLDQEIELKFDDSDIAVHSTNYHCGRKDTKAKSNLVLFNVEGKVY